MSDRQECPEYGCPHKWREDELQAHLEWDHNHSQRKAEKKVARVFNNA